MLTETLLMYHKVPVLRSKWGKRIYYITAYLSGFLNGKHRTTVKLVRGRTHPNILSSNWKREVNSWSSTSQELLLSLFTRTVLLCRDSSYPRVKTNITSVNLHMLELYRCNISTNMKTKVYLSLVVLPSGQMICIAIYNVKRISPKEKVVHVSDWMHSSMGFLILVHKLIVRPVCEDYTHIETL